MSLYCQQKRTTKKSGCWIGDYPYLERAELEALLAEDDDIWDALQDEAMPLTEAAAAQMLQVTSSRILASEILFTKRTKIRCTVISTMMTMTATTMRQTLSGMAHSFPSEEEEGGDDISAVCHCLTFNEKGCPFRWKATSACVQYKPMRRLIKCPLLSEGLKMAMTSAHLYYYYDLGRFSSSQGLTKVFLMRGKD